MGNPLRGFDSHPWRYLTPTGYLLFYSNWAEMASVEDKSLINIRITDEDVLEWRGQRVKLQEQLTELDRKLELVDLLAKSNGSNATPDLPALRDFSALDKYGKILCILKNENNYMSPKEIKNSLRQHEETSEVWGKDLGYVHQVLKRLKDQGRVNYGRNKKYRLPQ